MWVRSRGEPARSDRLASPTPFSQPTCRFRALEHVVGVHPWKKVSGGANIRCGKPQNRIWGLL